MKRLLTNSGIIVVLVMVLSLCMLTGCAKNDIEGSWILAEMQIGEKSYSLDEFASAVNADKAEELVIILEIDGNGSFVIHSGDANENIAEGQYISVESSDNEADSINEYAFTLSGGKYNVGVYIEEGRLVLHDTVSAVESKMIFEKK